MSWLSSLFKAEDPEPAPRISSGQQEVLTAAMSYLKPRVAEPTEYIPHWSELASSVESMMRGGFAGGTKLAKRGIFGAISGLEDIRARLAGEYKALSPENIAELFGKTYADPVMKMWHESVGPSVRESFNIPGAFYSGARGRGYTKAAEEFMGEQVTPKLWDALQSAMGARQSILSSEAQMVSALPALWKGAADLPTEELQKQFAAISSLLGIETAFLSPALSGATAPTMDWIAHEDPDVLGNIGRLGSIASVLLGGLGM